MSDWEVREMPSILSHCSKWIGRFPRFGPDPCQNLQLGRDLQYLRVLGTQVAGRHEPLGLNDILATSTSPKLRPPASLSTR